MLSRRLETPTVAHWSMAKRVIRYLKGSSKEWIMCVLCRKPLHLSAYTDAGYAGDDESRKSTTGVVVLSGGGPVIWKANYRESYRSAQRKPNQCSL